MPNNRGRRKERRLCRDNLTHSHLVKLTQVMMHGMYSIFQPQSVTGHGAGGDPISEKKKLNQLEGLREHVKEMLIPLACQKRRSQKFKPPRRSRPMIFLK